MLGLDLSMTTLTPTLTVGVIASWRFAPPKKREAGDPRKSPASSQLVSPLEVGASEARKYMLPFRLLQVFLLSGKALNFTDVRARSPWRVSLGISLGIIQLNRTGHGEEAMND